MNRLSRRKICLILIGILFIFLSACAPQPEKLWLKAPGWSRAVFIGNTRVGDPVSMVPDGYGGVVLFFVESTIDSPTLKLVSLDQEGSQTSGYAFTDIALSRPAKPRIFRVAEDLRLLWMSDGALFTALVKPSGEYLEAPKVISGDSWVDNYDASLSPSGALAVWFSSTSDDLGLYALSFKGTDWDRRLIDSEGTGAEIQFDELGNLHALWLRNPSPRGANPFAYGVFPEGKPQSGLGEVVTSPTIYGTTSLDGPHLGLDAGHVYIFWSLTFFTGPEAGTTAAYYVSFPRGNPEEISRAALISVPWSYELEYAESDTALQTGSRVPVSLGSMGGATYLLQITPIDKAASELIVTFFSRVGYLMRKAQGQVNALYFTDGLPTGYQQLSFSSSSSSTPYVTSDENGYVYLTWLEKGELPGWAVYFATTSPSMINTLASLTFDDVGRLSAEVIFGLLSGALLIPITLIWILLGGIVLMLTTRLTRGLQKWEFMRGTFPILVSIIVMWVVKIGVVPGILDYVPFSAWIPDIPAWLGVSLRILMPILIAILGLVIARAFSGDKISDVPNRFFLIYAIVDAFLTMAVYGVLIVIGF